jgi:hypothetical protein
LWHFDLPHPSPPLPLDPNEHHAISAIAFTHAALFSPAPSTLSVALKKGFVQNFTGLTKKTLTKYPPRSYAMVKGHMDQARKNLKATKTANELADPDNDFSPAVQDERSHFCYAALTKITGQVYSNQTGKFTLPSSNGNNYLFILYDYNRNLILAEPMKARDAQDIVNAYKTVHTKLCQAGLHPKLVRLDNECSAALKMFLINFQLPTGPARHPSPQRSRMRYTDVQEPLYCWPLQC